MPGICPWFRLGRGGRDPIRRPRPLHCSRAVVPLTWTGTTVPPVPRPIPLSPSPCLFFCCCPRPRQPAITCGSSLSNWIPYVLIQGVQVHLSVLRLPTVDAPGDPSQRDCFLAWHRKRPWFSALSHGGGEKAVSHVHPWSIDTLEHNGESLHLTFC